VIAMRRMPAETRPDGTERIVSSNARTQPMLEVIRTTDGGVTKQQRLHPLRLPRPDDLAGLAGGRNVQCL